MIIPPNLTLWQRILEWWFPWRRHIRERAERDTMKFVARKISGDAGDDR